MDTFLNAVWSSINDDTQKHMYLNSAILSPAVFLTFSFCFLLSDQFAILYRTMDMSSSGTKGM